MSYRFHVLICSAVLLLCGCGGGGSPLPFVPGGNNPSGGGFTLSTTSISLVGTQLAQAPGEQTANIHLTDNSTSTVGAGYKAGVAQPSWLTLFLTGSGTDFGIQFVISSSAMTMPLGVYSTTVTIGTSNASGTILQTRDVNVTFTLRNGLRVTSGGISAAFMTGHSDSSHNYAFTVAGPAGTRWTATSNATWLIPPAGEQTGSGNFNVTVNSAGVPTGFRDGQVTLTNVTDPTDTASFRVSLSTLLPMIRITSTNQLIVGGDAGLEATSLPISFSLETGTNVHPWSATLTTTSGGAWLRSDVVSGTVGQSGTTLNLDADRSTLAKGEYQGNVRIVTIINGGGLAMDIPVRLRLEEKRLLVSSTGVAFSKFPTPSRSVLSRTVRVTDTHDTNDVPWTASSNAPWLNVTASGTTGGNLLLQADSTGLAADATYEADVTISSPSNRIVNQQHIRVALAVRSADPSTSPIDPSSSDVIAIVANPVLPEMYVSKSFTSVDAYDVYSGTFLRSLPIDGSSALTISHDGRSLFAAGGGYVRIVNLATGTTTATYDSTGQASSSMMYARPDAHPVLLFGPHWSIDLESGSVMNVNSGTMRTESVSSDQRRVYGSDDYGGNQVYGLRVRYSSIYPTKLLYQSLGTNSGLETNYNRASIYSVAASQVSQRVFVGAYTPSDRIDVLDGQTLSLTNSMIGVSYPRAVQTSWNGIVVTAGMNAAPDGDLFVYDDNGTLRGQLDSGTTFIRERAIAISGDGTRLMSINDATGLRIQPVP